MTPVKIGRMRKRTIGLIAFVAGSVALLGVGGWWYWQVPVSSTGDLEFAQPLHVPPLLEGDVDEDGRRVFHLKFQEGTSEFRDGKETATAGLNGPFLGPTLRASRGETVAVHATNGMEEQTTLHWHGMHLPAVMDGGPHQPIGPGETWSPSWTIDQPASTLWFHPHPHGETEDQVYRGIAGVFLIDDAWSNELAIPSSYGVDDIPLVVQDRAFTSDGAFRERRPMFSAGGILGDTILVNGTYDPHFVATRSLLRLRIVNGSVARIYDFGFDDGRSFAMIASDAGLLEAPVTLDRLQLSPGERAEIVVELEPGDEPILRSFGASLGMDFFSTRMNGGDDTFDILQIRAAADLDASPALPSRLAVIDGLSADEATTTRRVNLSGRSINGREMSITRVDHATEADTVELWEVRGSGGGPHSLHIHLAHFLVLSIDGETPPPELSGWKDTIHLLPNREYRLVARFAAFADPESPYMFHCHILAHEDGGMMAQFVIIEPGQPAPSTVPVPGGHDHAAP